MRRDLPSFTPPASVLVLPAGRHANQKLTLVAPALGMETGTGEVAPGTYTFTYKFRSVAIAKSDAGQERMPAATLEPEPVLEMAVSPGGPVVDVASKVNALAAALGCVVRDDSARTRCNN